MAVYQTYLIALDQTCQRGVLRMAGALLEHRNHAGLACAGTFSQKGCRQNAFSGAGRAGDQQGIPLGKTATEHFVQLGDAHFQTGRHDIF